MLLRDKCYCERLRYCTVEANYWQIRSIERPLCDSRATCYSNCSNVMPKQSYLRPRWTVCAGRSCDFRVEYAMTGSEDEDRIRWGHWRADCVTDDLAHCRVSDGVQHRASRRSFPTYLVWTCAAVSPANRKSSCAPAQPYHEQQET